MYCSAFSFFIFLFVYVPEEKILIETVWKWSGHIRPLGTRTLFMHTKGQSGRWDIRLIISPKRNGPVGPLSCSIINWFDPLTSIYHLLLWSLRCTFYNNWNLIIIIIIIIWFSDMYLGLTTQVQMHGAILLSVAFLCAKYPFFWRLHGFHLL